MQRRFSGMVLLSLWALLLCGQAPPPLLELPYNPSIAFSDEEITVSPQAVRLQVKARALQEVLQYIQHTSGIRFSLPHTMLTVPVTAVLEAPDWPTAVRQLLRPFQTAEVWQNGGTQLRQVFILDSEPAAPSSVLTPRAPQDTVEQPETAGAADRTGSQ